MDSDRRIFEIADWANALEPAGFDAWVVGRLVGKDPHFPDPRDDERDLMFQRLLLEPGLDFSRSGELKDILRREVTCLAAERKWHDIASARALLGLVEAVMEKYPKPNSCASLLWPFVREPQEPSDLHDACLRVVVSQQYRRAFDNGYLQELYASRICGLPKDYLRAGYEASIVRGLDLVGAEQLVAWIPQVQSWTKAIDFSLNIVLGRLAAPTRCGPEELGRLLASAMDNVRNRSIRSQIQHLMERNQIPLERRGRETPPQSSSQIRANLGTTTSARRPSRGTVVRIRTAVG